MTGPASIDTAATSHGDLQRRLFDQSYPLKLRQRGYFTGSPERLVFWSKVSSSRTSKEFDEWAGGPGQTHYETEKNDGTPVCQQVSALLVGIRCGTGFYQESQAERQTVLHEYQLQSTTSAVHTRSDRLETLRVQEDLYSPAKLWS